MDRILMRSILSHYYPTIIPLLSHYILLFSHYPTNHIPLLSHYSPSAMADPAFPRRSPGSTGTRRLGDGVPRSVWRPRRWCPPSRGRVCQCVRNIRWNIFGAFHSHGGSPSHHPFLDRDFPRNQPSSEHLGYPHDLGHPHLW